MNWSELNWIINAVVISIIGAAVRWFFSYQKEHKKADMEFQLWKQEVMQRFHCLEKNKEKV